MPVFHGNQLDTAVVCRQFVQYNIMDENGKLVAHASPASDPILK
ncbi:hypothetical protein [Paenibacillus oleatilyticus]|nr:hypothetical protein [Paenibacillus oleatilyticus]